MNDTELQKIIDELHIYEKKISEGIGIRRFRRNTRRDCQIPNMDIKSVMSAAGILESIPAILVSIKDVLKTLLANRTTENKIC